MPNAISKNVKNVTVILGIGKITGIIVIGKNETLPSQTYRMNMKVYQCDRCKEILKFRLDIVQIKDKKPPFYATRFDLCGRCITGLKKYLKS